MKDKIICLVGPSGSGKTTIAKELEKEGYNIIHSYTTREPREPNEWGHTFISDWFPVYAGGVWVGFENTANPNSRDYKYIDIDHMIAYRKIYEEYYFATKDQYQGKGTSIYAVCPDGAKQVQENVKDAEIVTIFLTAEEVIRLRRMRSTRGIEGAHDRIYDDRLIFQTCKCDYVVDGNRTVEEVVVDVIRIIEGEI